MNNHDMPYDDRYCLYMIREGDEKFFNLLFKKYRDRLYAFLFRVTKSEDVSEELVLDVFLKIWQRRESLNEIENVEGFLYRVAHNKAIDFFRTVRKNPELQKEIWDKAFETAPSGYNADELLFEKELENAVQLAEEQLPQQRKKVYYLRKYEGLSYKDIAERLNLSHNTVRNHLTGSARFIREFLLKNDIARFLLVIILNIFL